MDYEKLKQEDNLSEAYIEVVRRVSTSQIDGNKANAAIENRYIEVVRRISGGNLTRINPSGKKDGDLIGNAELGVLEVTRRLSGTAAAICEADALLQHPKTKIMSSGQVELTILSDEHKKGSARNFGLGSVEWHLLDQSELFKELSSRIEGLTTAEQEVKFAEYGPNVITPPKQTHWFIKFLWNLVGGFQLMLWFGSVLCFVVFGISDGTDIQTLALAVVLIVVVLVTTIFQSYQEGKSDQVMAALRALAPTTAFVFRDGTLQNVPVETLVPGDVVKVTGGEKVPADIRVLSSSDLKVNNASLTGENVDIKLGAD
eukprot:gene30435-40443_t